MGYVRSRTFCCCIPVRVGVFLLAFFGLGCGVVLGTFGWLTVAKLKEQKITISKRDEFALYFSASIYTLLALLSLFGFIGAITKSIGLVRSFASGLVIHLGFSIGIGIYSIYAVFSQDAKKVYNQCMDNAKWTENAASICKDSFAIAKGVTIAVFIITWILQLYGYFIVRRYVDQLEREDFLKRQVLTKISRPTPINVTTYSAFGTSTHPRSAFVNGNDRV